MAKLLLFVSLMVLMMIILVSAFMPSNGIMYLASGNSLFQYIREFMAGLIFLQLVTHPPRSIFSRTVTGLIALSIGAWSIEATLIGSMQFLDSLSLFAAATSLGVSALEVSGAKFKKPTIKEYHSGNPLLA